MATSAELEAEVGHPARRWDDLKERVQADAIHRFADVQDDWLALMWSLDRFRSEGIPPPGLTDVDALNRGKGNWFAELV
ncbi:MAG: hypothetical protein ACRDT7_19140, partial [Microbacterium sp.]